MFGKFISDMKAKSDAKKAAEAERRLLEEERRYQSLIDERLALINSHKDMIVESSVAYANDYAVSGADLKEKYEFFKKIDKKDLEEEYINKYIFVNRQDLVYQSSKTENYSMLSGDFTRFIDSGIVRRIVENARDEHKVRSSSNAILTGAAMFQKNYGLAAFSAANSISNAYAAGSHNGSVANLFEREIFNVRFSAPVSGMSDVYRRYTHAAWRMVVCKVGDSDIATKAFFSLIVNANGARWFTRDDSDKYVRCAGQEFINRFAQYIWSPQEAAAHIDEQKNKSEFVKRVISLEALNVRVYLRKGGGVGATI